MINQDPNPVQSSTITSISMAPIGGIAQVLRSGDAYKAVGESVSRTTYPALSAAFPRNGSLSSEAGSVPSTINVHGMAYGNGVFVAVAYNTTPSTQMFYSRDRGKTWRVANCPSGAWNALTYGNGKFVAVAFTISGVSAGAMTSTDGINWTASGNLSTSVGWAGVAWSDSLSLYVAVAANSTVAASSTDGVTWSPRTLPTNTSWSSVTFGGGKFVAVSNSVGTSAAYSLNGTSWSACVVPNGGYGSVAYGNSKFVAVGFAAGITPPAYSSDGIAWVQGTIPAVAGTGLIGVAFGDGLFLGLTSITGLCCVSYDGVTWVEKIIATTSNAISYLTWGAGSFSGIYGTSGSNAICIYSENLTDSDYLYLSGTAGQFIRVK